MRNLFRIDRGPGESRIACKTRTGKINLSTFSFIHFSIKFNKFRFIRPTTLTFLNPFPCFRRLCETCFASIEVRVSPGLPAKLEQVELTKAHFLLFHFSIEFNKFCLLEPTALTFLNPFPCFHRSCEARFASIEVRASPGLPAKPGQAKFLERVVWFPCAKFTTVPSFTAWYQFVGILN